MNDYLLALIIYMVGVFVNVVLLAYINFVPDDEKDVPKWVISTSWLFIATCIYVVCIYAPINLLYDKLNKWFRKRYEKDNRL